MRPEPAVIGDAGLERAALEQVPRRVPVARRLRTLQRVLDYRPPQQDGRQRLPALERLRRGIEDEIQVAVDLAARIDHQSGRLAQGPPLDEEDQGHAEVR